MLWWMSESMFSWIDCDQLRFLFEYMFIINCVSNIHNFTHCISYNIRSNWNRYHHPSRPHLSVPSICSYCNCCQTPSLCSPQSVTVSWFALVAPPPTILEWLVILSSSSTLGAVYSDAYGLFGCGMFSQPHGLFQLQWPPTWLSVNIATKEFVPVVMAAALWDNLAMVSITNKRSANNPFCPTFLVPVLFFCLL